MIKVLIIHERYAESLALRIKASVPGVHVLHSNRTDVMPEGYEDCTIAVLSRFFPEEVYKMPSLQWIQLIGVGFDHIDFPRLGDRILLTNAGSVPAAAVAETVLAWILAHARGIPELVSNQKARLWTPPKMSLLRDSKVAIVGLGKIGLEIAQRLKVFQPRITGISRSMLSSDALSESLGVERLAEVAAKSDFLVIAVPGGRTTRNLVSREVIRGMKKGGFLINVSRNSVLDVNALCDALEEGMLSGAMLDVFDVEPLPAQDPLWNVRNLHISPHCAFLFPNHLEGVFNLITGNLQKFIDGRHLMNICKPD